MKEEKEARLDAVRALTVKPCGVDIYKSGFGRSCLGAPSIEFLNYKLRSSLVYNLLMSVVLSYF